MASGEAEPLQYTTTALRVSIHCEGCKKKVRKVLHSIEGVYKVTVDAAQHKVVVTSSVGADALVRRLNKAGKQAALWPAPAPAAEAKKKPEEAAPPAADDVCNKGAVGADKADAKPKDKQANNKKPEKENLGSAEKKQEKAVEAPKDDGKKQDSEAKEKKASSEPAKEAAAEEEASGAEEGSAKKGGKKKKNKHKDVGGEGEAAPAAEKRQPPPPPPPQPVPAHAALPHLLGPPEQRPHGGVFPYYAAQPVMSYNVAPPSASVSYHYAPPTPAVPMQPMPPYGYPPHMMPPPPLLPEYMYGPPGMRASPPQESYNNMFNEESANSCSLM